MGGRLVPSSTIAKRRKELAAFENRHKELGRVVEDRPRAQTVDYLLVGSAIARARWELDYVRGWQRNPWFLSGPDSGLSVRQSDPTAALRRGPQCGDRQPRSGHSTDHLPTEKPTSKIRPVRWPGYPSINCRTSVLRLEEMARELKPYLSQQPRPNLIPRVRAASTPWKDIGDGSSSGCPGMSTNVAVGRENYLFLPEACCA